MIEQIEQPTEAPDRDSPFASVMKTWARWMTLADHQHSEGNANPQDVKEFMACGEAVDTMVNDLVIHQRWAIRKAFGVASVWQFSDISFEAALLSAEAILTIKMSKNVATKRYFN